jgi:hypothetical protein
MAELGYDIGHACRGGGKEKKKCNTRFLIGDAEQQSLLPVSSATASSTRQHAAAAAAAAAAGHFDTTTSWYKCQVCSQLHSAMNRLHESPKTIIGGGGEPRRDQPTHHWHPQ